MALTFIVGFATAAFVLQIIRMVINSWQIARNAKRLGCGNLPRYPCKDPIGINTLKQSLVAVKEETLPELAEKRFEVMAKQESRYVTTFMIRNLGRDGIFTIDPKNIQAILATQFKEFELGDSRRRAMHPLLGTGIFTADGEDWSRSRSLLRPQFTRDQVSRLDLEEEHVQKAMQALPVGANGWTAFTDIQTIFFRLTIDSATEFLFGESVESQLGGLKGLNRPEDSFAGYFDYSQFICAQRGRFERLAFLAETKEGKVSDKKVQTFVDKVVAAALTATGNGKKNREKGNSPYVFLDALLEVTHDPIELRSQLLNILLAGRDTTASLLSWTTLLLARNPDVFNKLRETIIFTFGTYSNPQPITFAALKCCQYLQYVMNEVLRLYPVVPLNRRNATRDTTIPRGGGPEGEEPVYVRKGQSVFYTTHVMHRRKDLWGPDADEFKPGRWANRKAGWEYIPFNGGPRICLGQQFALTEVGYVIVRLLQRFDQIQDMNANRQVRQSWSLTSSPADRLTVRMHEAVE
ncbi:hypothetical protein N7490_001752 [Penicillium lividum]|nr:hypothetical protein N7490_001752 [Penicillium lividum]